MKISPKGKAQAQRKPSYEDYDSPLLGKKGGFKSQNETAGLADIQDDVWKPPRLHSYETMALADSKLNFKIRPCGFRKNGKMRKFKNSTLIAKVKTKCRLRGRNPRLAVCITMYNEDEEELKTTLSGVIHNYNELRLDASLEYKKEDFVVFVICDGFDRIPESFKKFATEKNFFDLEVLKEKGYMTTDREGKLKMKDMRDIMDPGVKVPLNILHLFMVQTWDFGLQEDILKARRINLIFAIKQRNDGKINSHKWFFQGICKYLKPEFCLMLDIGTRPDRHAVYKLQKYMMKHVTCGGCCGEIEVDFSQEKGISGSYFVKAAQFYEYKVSHSPDKLCESFFGFNSVLPGAYSMFRWKAIKGPPLDAFFKSVTRDDPPSCAEANEYLAEDRVMCLQIYIKRHSKFHLAYLPDCKSFTDAPASLAVLIKQRRRWMNGAMFGTLKVMANVINMTSCRRTKHSFCRQLFMIFYMIYYFVVFTLSFLSVGAMYTSITLFITQTFGKFLEVSGQGKFVPLITDVFNYGYLFLLSLSIVMSLTTSVDRAIGIFKFLLALFGFLIVVSMVGIIYFLIQTGFYAEVKVYDLENKVWINTGDYQLQILVIAGIVMYSTFLAPMILRPLDFLSNFMQYTLGMITYIFMIPTFVNVFQVYSMCNLHDISWGNRPTQGVETVAIGSQNQEVIKQDYMVFRAYFFYFWIICNFLFSIITISLIGGNVTTLNDNALTFTFCFTLFMAGLTVFKLFFALLYTIKWNCRQCCCPYYRKSKGDVAEEFKRIRKDRNGAVSSDEDEDDEKVFNMDAEGNPQVAETTGNQEIDDSDNDDVEFEDAHNEEVHDKTLESIWKQKALEISYASIRGQPTQKLKELFGDSRASQKQSNYTETGHKVSQDEYGGQSPIQPSILKKKQTFETDKPKGVRFGHQMAPIIEEDFKSPPASERQQQVTSPKPGVAAIFAKTAAQADQNQPKRIPQPVLKQSDVVTSPNTQKKQGFSLGDAFSDAETNKKSVRFKKVNERRDMVREAEEEEDDEIKASLNPSVPHSEEHE